MGSEEVRKGEKRLDLKEVLFERKNMIAKITINRPHVHNAYSTTTLNELAQAFDDASDDDSIGVAVLTGAGDRAFCLVLPCWAFCLL